MVDETTHLELRKVTSLHLLILELPPHLQKAAYRAMSAEDGEKAVTPEALAQADRTYRTLLTLGTMARHEEEVLKSIRESSTSVYHALIETLASGSTQLEVRRDIQFAIQSGAITHQEAQDILRLPDVKDQLRRARAVRNIAEQLDEALDVLDRPFANPEKRANLRDEFLRQVQNVALKERAAFIENRRRRFEELVDDD